MRPWNIQINIRVDANLNMLEEAHRGESWGQEGSSFWLGHAWQPAGSEKRETEGKRQRAVNMEVLIASIWIAFASPLQTGSDLHEELSSFVSIQHTMTPCGTSSYYSHRGSEISSHFSCWCHQCKQFSAGLGCVSTSFRVCARSVRSLCAPR